MKNFVIKPLGFVMLMAVIAIGSVDAREVAHDGSGSPHTAKAKAKKKSTRGGQTKYQPGSEETVKERSARLSRECKGAVNAGACAGYTR